MTQGWVSPPRHSIFHRGIKMTIKDCNAGAIKAGIIIHGSYDFALGVAANDQEAIERNAKTIEEQTGVADLIEALECWVDDAQYDPACAELLAKSDAALAKAKGVCRDNT